MRLSGNNLYMTSNLRSAQSSKHVGADVSMTSHYEVPTYNVLDKQARVLNKLKHHLEVDPVSYTEPCSEYYFRFWVPDKLDSQIEKKFNKYDIYYTKWSSSVKEPVDNKPVVGDAFYDIDVY